MIKLNGKKIDLGHFPDGTLLIKKEIDNEKANITWLFENNEELVALIFLVKHLRAKGIVNISLDMPYIPNARQDRVKKPEDVFTLKYFAEIINSLEFTRVRVLDPHSYVSEALLDRVEITTPKSYVEKVIETIEKCGQSNNNERNNEKADTVIKDGNKVLMFYPDEGAMKRYNAMFDRPYAFGIKKRDWTTGEIQGLDVSGQTELIPGSTVLIVDDICSRGGTFYFSAKKLKELGAKEVYLYISHCENTILDGEVLNSNLIEKVFTTNSIFTKEHAKIQIVE